MDEFFDIWVGHKYSDVGDYGTYFNTTATNPTGNAAVPGTPTGAPWYQVDVTALSAGIATTPASRCKCGQ